MSIQRLKDTLERLGYYAPIRYRKWEDTEVVHIDQKLKELNDFGHPILKTLGFVWYKDRKYFMDYRRRTPHPDVREFLSVEEIVSFIQREFPLIEEK